MVWDSYGSIFSNTRSNTGRILKLKKEIWAKLNLKYELKNMKIVKLFVFYHFQTTNIFIISINFKIKKTLEKVNNFDKYFNKPSEVTSVKSRSLT